MYQSSTNRILAAQRAMADGCPSIFPQRFEHSPTSSSHRPLAVNLYSSADDWRYRFSLPVNAYSAIRSVIYNHLLRNWSFYGHQGHSWIQALLTYTRVRFWIRAEIQRWS